MRHMSKVLATAAIAVGALLVAPAASATTGSTDAAVSTGDSEIAAMLQAVPGGVLVDADHAVWPELGMQMTAARSVNAVGTVTAAGTMTPSAVGTCSSGKVCAYSGVNRSGSMLSWSTCGTFTISSSFTVRSIADARSSGYLQARNGTTVVATANAGASTNVFGTVTNVRCVS